MNIELYLEGHDANEKTLISIKDWIKKERINGLRIQHKSKPIKEGFMGANLDVILSIVLGAPAVVTLVKCVHSWIKLRRPRIIVNLKIGESAVKINAENLPDQQIVIKEVLEIIKSLNLK